MPGSTTIRFTPTTRNIAARSNHCRSTCGARFLTATGMFLPGSISTFSITGGTPRGRRSCGWKPGGRGGFRSTGDFSIPARCTGIAPFQGVPVLPFRAKAKRGISLRHMDREIPRPLPSLRMTILVGLSPTVSSCRTASRRACWRRPSRSAAAANVSTKSFFHQTPSRTALRKHRSRSSSVTCWSRMACPGPRRPMTTASAAGS